MAKISKSKKQEIENVEDINTENIESQESVFEDDIQDEQDPELDYKVYDDMSSQIAIEGTNITEYELEQFRKEYKKLYTTMHITDVFLWHRLNRKAYTQICEETANMFKDDDDMLSYERQKRFVAACVLYPRNIGEIEYYMEDDIVIEQLAKEILFHSGFFRPLTVEV